jgi:hypothetical protein
MGMVKGEWARWGDPGFCFGGARLAAFGVDLHGSIFFLFSMHMHILGIGVCMTEWGWTPFPRYLSAHVGTRILSLEYEPDTKKESRYIHDEVQSRAAKHEAPFYICNVGTCLILPA